MKNLTLMSRNCKKSSIFGLNSNFLLLIKLKLVERKYAASCVTKYIGLEKGNFYFLTCTKIQIKTVFTGKIAFDEAAQRTRTDLVPFEN